MTRHFRLLLTILVGLCFCVTETALAEMPPQEVVTVRKMPAASPHWVFVMIPFSSSLLVTSILAVDGDSLKVLGTVTGGIVSDLAIAPDHKELYTADTFYSRGSRGVRTDVVTIYDLKTLDVAGEIKIPTKRQLSIPDRSSMEVTPDGHFLLIANMTPATSATVVDLKSRKVAGEIEMAGCAEILVTGDRQFVSVCGDGSMLTTQFNDEGKATSQKRTAKPFFDPEKDPVFGVPAIIGKIAYFISYHGMVYPVDVSGSQAEPETTWSLLNGKEKAEDWRPGGWQPLWGYAKRGLLYVLMHQGGEWTHKQPGTEVWVYNARDHRRVDTIMLPQSANAILTTQDSNPLLFALSEEPGTLQKFSALSGKYLGTLKDVPATPFELFGL
jgi:methylamine dehydrogenase heavy chain